MVFQRSKGKPIAYLTNKKFFWKYEFFVKQDVLDKALERIEYLERKVSDLERRF